MAYKLNATRSNRFRAAREDRLGADGDVVIVGAGLAGLFTALKLAPMPVTVLAAAPLGEGASTVWAQGGVAAAVGNNDEAAAHAADTIAAGAGIVDADVASFVAAEGPRVSPTSSPMACPSIATPTAHFSLSQEAAHSRRASCTCPATAPARRFLRR